MTEVSEKAMTDEEFEQLRERVNKFNSLQLPGQPMGMHMGTAYLVGDLLRAVESLRRSHSRESVLEEAAKVADSEYEWFTKPGNPAERIASRIRALRSLSSPNPQK